MTFTNIPLNRPVVSTLAQIDSLDRVIAADRVREIERIAARTTAAGQLISQAEAMCRESLDEQARAAWAQGVAQGRAEVLAKLSELIDAIAERRRLLDRELMDLVADAVGRIIRDLPADVLTANLIANALEESLEHRGRATLRLHPSRVADAERALATRLGADPSHLTITIAPDDGLEQEDCILETSSGVVDASLAVQLDTLRSLLRAAT